MRKEAFADGTTVDPQEDLRRKLRGLIARLGDKETDPQLPVNVQNLAEVLSKEIVNRSLILETLVSCVIEFPHKPQVYAALIAQLGLRDSAFVSEFGTLCWSAYQRVISGAEWYSIASLTRFWGEAVRQRFVSVEAYVELLKKLLSQANDILETYSLFADSFVDAAIWAFSWTASTLYERDFTALDELEAAFDSYFLKRKPPTETLEQSRVFLGGLENEDELSVFWESIKGLRENSFSNELCIQLAVVADPGSIDEFALSEITFPSANVSDPRNFRSRFHLFDESNLQLKSNEFVIPPPTSYARLASRRLVSSILHFFEINPKEGSRVLSELAFGASRIHSSLILVEQIFDQLLALPRPEHSVVYYESLLIALCKSVKFVPPFMAKGVSILLDRSKDYAVDVEAMLRLAGYFAIHLSHFEFKWNWSQWESYVQTPKFDLRRVFVGEVLYRLIRLSYLERIKDLNLPPYYHDLIPQKIETNFAYSGDSVAAQVLDAIHASEPVTTLIERLYPATSVQNGQEDHQFEKRLHVLFQCMLESGKATISHTLSILEKYLTSLREQCNLGGASARRGVLRACESYYQKNPLLRTLMIQKLAFYKVVGPVDVAQHVERWISEGPGHNAGEDVEMADESKKDMLVQNIGDIWEWLDASCSLGRSKAEILEHRCKKETSEEKQRAFRANAVEENKQGRIAARRIFEATKRKAEQCLTDGDADSMESKFWQSIAKALERKHL